MPRAGIIQSGPKAGRMPCIVMGCGRTFKDEGHEAVICGQHYRLADKRLRSLRTAVLRKGRRNGWSPRLIAMEERLWDKVVAQATERNMGL